MSLLSLREAVVTHQNLLPTLTSKEVELLESHFVLLQQWNERINLVSRKSIGQAFSYHYADSLNMVEAARPFLLDSVFDVGSGSGFPGAIFAMHFPERQITLFEKNLKKQTFLTAAVTQIPLSNVTLAGALPDRLPKGFFFARAVFTREEIFYRLKPVMAKGSRLALASGGSNEKDFAPAAFTKLEERKYSLPEGAGDRKIEFFERST